MVLHKGVCSAPCCTPYIRMTAQLKFADGTVVLGSITNNDETAYLQEVEGLASWCQTNCLPLNVSKTKASGGLQERTAFLNPPFLWF